MSYKAEESRIIDSHCTKVEGEWVRWGLTEGQWASTVLVSVAAAGVS